MASTSTGTRGLLRPFNEHSLRGFTLIELLATFFIISLLVAILAPRFASARHQAKRTACLSHERTVALALINYANANNDNLPPPGPEDDEGRSPRELIWRVDRQLINLGVLKDNELPDFSNFFCPSATVFNFSRDVSLINTNSTPAIGGDYAYGISMAPGEKKSIGNLGSLALLADNFVGSKYGTDIGLGQFSHKTGYNISFSDGSGVFWRDTKGQIAKEKISYDNNEADSYNFSVLNPAGDRPPDSPPDMRIYEVWHDMSELGEAN